MNKFAAFFQSDNGTPCMAHLILFMAWFPATWLVLHIGTSDGLAVYLGAFVLNRLSGKFMDLKQGAAQ